MKNNFSILSVLVFSSAAACSGGQTGDLSGQNDKGGENTGGDQCNDVLHPLASLDEATSLGFSAGQILEFAAGEFKTPLVWGQPSNVSFGPESGTGELTMNVSYEGGALYFVESTPKEGGQEGGEIGLVGSGCSNSLRMDVTVSVQTAGGALNEAFEASLETSSRFAAEFNEPLEPASLNGSFEILSVEPAEGQVKQFGLSATLTPFGVTGTLSSIVEVHYPGAAGDPTGGAVGAVGVTYASFPGSAACADGSGQSTGFSTPAAQMVVGFSGAQAIEQWNAATPVSVTWKDDSATELTLVATAQGDGCVRLGAWYDAEPFRASYPVRITATTADGRLDGEYAGEMLVAPDAEGNVASILGTANLPLALEQAAESGFSNVGDVSAYHRLFFTMSSKLESGTFSGSLALNGHTDPPCLTDPPPPDPDGMGAPGCSGTEVTPIESTSWGEPQQ